MDLRRYNLSLLLFSLASLMMGIYSGLYDPSFNNYLAQVHHLGEIARGALEFPRELPGFLVVVVFTLLLFLKDTRVTMVAALMVAVSLWGQGFFAYNMVLVVLWMLLWSTGAHLFMVMRSSLALRLADKNQAGKLLGQIGGLEAAGVLLGSLLVYIGVSRFDFSFALIFGIAGSCALTAAVCMAMIKGEPIKRPPRYLLFKKKYNLFYLLNILFGARKQIFLTFAPWVLIRLFDQGVEVFAILSMIGTAVGLFFRPLLGMAIDRIGEKRIIAAESLGLIVICILYAFAPAWFPANLALTVIMACFITDQVLFAVNMARATYLNRIVDTPDDIGPTLSMGVTLDHMVSMTVPIGGGLIWASFGYQWVFLAAAGIALLNLLLALNIPDLSPPAEPQTQSA
ncbi:MAG TPA: MFS transporter [Syntrophomonas sp.]|jgi:MFS family permease|nr:MFS transporter [Syntrophomonas sp.]